MNGPASSDRFTAWFIGAERDGIRRLADELGSSQNYVVRTALRALLGLPVSPWAWEILERELARRKAAAKLELELERREAAAA